jgi:hypothetical protein
MSSKKRVVKQNNRGLYKRLYNKILSFGKVGIFTVEDFKDLNLPNTVISNGLNYLAKEKDLLSHGPIRGTWILHGEAAIHKDPETVVIDNLLTAMAQAEPVLKKLKKIQALLKDI